jgi:hypothetical protein
MTSREEQYRLLEKTLAAAYHKRKETQINTGWQGSVMMRIRNMRSFRRKEETYFESFGGLIWRLVPVTCLLIALVGGILIQTDMLQSVELTQVFFQDSTDLQLFPKIDLS